MISNKILYLFLLSTIFAQAMEKSEESNTQTYLWNKIHPEMRLEILSHLSNEDLKNKPAVSRNFEELRKELLNKAGQKLSIPTPNDLQSFVSTLTTLAKIRNVILSFMPEHEDLEALNNFQINVTVPAPKGEDKLSEAKALLLLPYVRLEFPTIKGDLIPWELDELKQLWTSLNQTSDLNPDLVSQAQSKIRQALVTLKYNIHLNSSEPALGCYPFLSNVALTGFNYKIINALDEVLATNRSIRSLDLSYNHIGVKGMKALAATLAHNTTLRSLNLSNNNIGVKKMKSLATMLEHNTTLRSLNLSNNNIGVKRAKALAAMLEHNATLTSLNLSDNNIGVKGMKALAAILEHNATLTVFNLSGNKIRARGGEALATMLEHNTTLRSLDLSYNKIGVEGMEALAATLACNTTLRSLDLSGNNISVEGVEALATTLAYNTTLRSLYLSGNNIGVEGVKALAAMLEKNTTLRSLHLDFNSIGAGGGEALAAMLEYNTTLTSLYMIQNYIFDDTKNSFNQLKALKPYLNISY